MNSPKIIWSISGHDNTGGAGMAADIRMAQSFGVHLCPIITGLTAQNHKSVSAIESVSAYFLRQQCDALMETHPPHAIKVGMLTSRDACQAVADLFRRLPAVPKIIDTPLISSSGSALLSDDGFGVLVDEILPLADLVTPNYQEILCLLGLDPNKKHQLSHQELGRRLIKLGAKAFLLKGGHWLSDKAIDYYHGEGSSFFMHSARFDRELRGTGCQMATAIACGVALGWSWPDAVVYAKARINQSFRTAQRIDGRYYSIGFAPFASESDGPAMSLTHWRPNDFPEVTTTETEFPLRFDAVSDIGFYPIVPDCEWLEKLAGWGVTCIQLRLKDMALDKVELEIAKAVKITSSYPLLKLFINDYWQLAIKHCAYGVHLGQEDLHTADVMAIAKAGVRLGISTHSYCEAAIAKAYHPSYVALGPIFETTCKSMAFGPQGYDRISEWRGFFDQGLVAIGGLQLQHAQEVAKRGADGLALISDVIKATNPQQRVVQWLDVGKRMGETKHHSFRRTDSSV